MRDLKTDLQQETKAAILAYNMNRIQIAQNAAREGGADAVDRLEAEFTALCNADFALAQARLNEKSSQYRQLMEEAVSSGVLLKQAIIDIQSTAVLIDCMAKTVALAGRALLMLAV